MNSKRASLIVIIVFFLVALLVPQARADERRGVVPMRSLPGRAWRIGYCETGPFFNYDGTLHGIIRGLHDLGWIDVPIGRAPFVDGQEDTLSLWKWVGETNRSPWLDFVQDAHYSLETEGAEDAVLSRLLEVGDLDLMIVMGTYAGRVLSGLPQKTPLMVFSTSNAVQSGIVESATDSGKENVWAHVDAERYRRQIRVFHDLVSFKRLGVVYEDSIEGRAFAALDDLRQLSKDLDFLLVTRTVKEASGGVVTQGEREQYHRDLKEAYADLANEVDAFYLTAGSRDNSRLKDLLAPFVEAGIPVFSQMGAVEVRRGALLSLYRADFYGVGRFGAEKIAKVLNGASPRSLSQVYGDTPSIVANIAVAEAAGIRAPFDILLIVDHFFHAVE